MKRILLLTIIVGMCFSTVWISLPHAKAAADPGLVGYWKFDEGSGSIAHDSSENGNAGTIYTATWTTGTHGSALHFDGVNSFVEVSSNPSLSSFTQLTLEAWIKPDSLGGLTAIIDKGNGLGYLGDEYGLQLDTDKIRLILSAGGPDPNGWIIVVDSPSLITAGKWFHVAGVWNSTDYTLYIDGNIVKSGPVLMPGATTHSTSNSLTIGSFTTSGWGSFNGVIDEVKMYNYARTADQIAADIRNITLFPTTGFASTTVVGSGFSNNARVTITWDGTTIPTIPNTVTTDGTGSFTALISVPTQTTPGLHPVKATDESGNWASATFTVINMTGPQGPKGDKGDVGPAGSSGEAQLVLIAFSAGASILAICLATIALFRKRA